MMCYDVYGMMNLVSERMNLAFEIMLKLIHMTLVNKSKWRYYYLYHNIIRSSLRFLPSWIWREKEHEKMQLRRARSAISPCFIIGPLSNGGAVNQTDHQFTWPISVASIIVWNASNNLLSDCVTSFFWRVWLFQISGSSVTGSRSRVLHVPLAAGQRHKLNHGKETNTASRKPYAKKESKHLLFLLFTFSGHRQLLREDSHQYCCICRSIETRQ